LKIPESEGNHESNSTETEIRGGRKGSEHHVTDQLSRPRRKSCESDKKNKRKQPLIISPVSSDGFSNKNADKESKIQAPWREKANA